MGNAELQQLSTRYASGELDKPTYRLQRKELIDTLTGVQLDETPAKAPNPVNTVPTQSPVDSRIRAAAALLVLLVTLAIVVYFTMPEG